MNLVSLPVLRRLIITLRLLALSLDFAVFDKPFWLPSRGDGLRPGLVAAAACFTMAINSRVRFSRFPGVCFSIFG